MAKTSSQKQRKVPLNNISKPKASPRKKKDEPSDYQDKTVPDNKLKSDNESDNQINILIPNAHHPTERLNKMKESQSVADQLKGAKRDQSQSLSPRA